MESYLYTIAGIVETGFQENEIEQENSLLTAKDTYIKQTFIKYFAQKFS